MGDIYIDPADIKCRGKNEENGSRKYELVLKIDFGEYLIVVFLDNVGSESVLMYELLPSEIRVLWGPRGNEEDITGEFLDEDAELTSRDLFEIMTKLVLRSLKV